VKRAFDVAVAVLALALLALPMLMIALLVRLRLGSPVFFVQERPGRKGVPFRLVKFRTMHEAHDGAGRLLPNEERLSRLGRLLRRTSLDELPELWNVLRGDMSLVGPRPLLMQYLPLYSARQARRHEVRPGLTGWAQINGRNAIGWKEKFELDVWYVEHRSFWLDLRILAVTVIKVLKREGISPDARVGPPPFQGGRTDRAGARHVLAREPSATAEP
jgi:sugar transferase EpsL